MFLFSRLLVVLALNLRHAVSTCPVDSSHHYVVVLRPNLTDTAIAHHLSSIQKRNKDDNALLARFGNASSYSGVTLLSQSIPTYTVRLSKQAAVRIQNIAEVLIVEKDSTVSHCQDEVPDDGHYQHPALHSRRTRADSAPTPRSHPSATPSSSANQPRARKGLVRISHLYNNVNSHEYVYRESVGRQATIYSFDSGVRLSHSEFEGRVRSGIDLTSSSTTTDTNGHGTHVMAIALGKTFGVAKHALGVSVKTLDSRGSGQVSVIIRGIDWVLRQSTVPNNLKIINLSFAGVYNAALNRVVEQAVAAGCHVVVAAGNEGTDVIKYSPASSPSALTIAAIDDFDRATNYTNHGTAIDFVAPGNTVLSAWWRSDTDTYSDTGTSMAAPHVTGLIAYILGLRGAMTPAAMRSELVKLSKTQAAGFPVSTIPRLIYNGSGK